MNAAKAIRPGMRLVLAATLVAAGWTPGPSVAGDGVEFSAACDATYVNKRVGANEQWAITWDLVARASGNVFKLDGGPPSFVECWRRPGGTADRLAFDCYGAPPCRQPPCADSWVLLPGPTEVPASFLYPPGVDPDDPGAACSKRYAVCAEGCAARSVQEAIDRAPPNSFVRVGRGTWDGDVRVVDKSITIAAAPGAVVRGSGTGAVVSLSCDREPASFVQWLGGTITGGGRNAPGGSYAGGGVENLGCTASIQGAQVVANETWGSGGGFVNLGEALVGRSGIARNSAGNGGGIANYGSLELLEVDLDDNASGSGPVATRGGGGLLNYPGAIASVRDSSIDANEAPEGCCGGGGVLNLGDLEIAATNVSTNRGDGIRNEGGTLAVEGSTLSGNAGGGLWNRAGSSAVVERSDVRSNGGRSIGGIENEGVLALRDVRIEANRAGPLGPGGGILNRGTLALDRVVISGNSTEDPAGAGFYGDGGSIAANLVTVVGNAPRNCVGVPFPCP